MPKRPSKKSAPVTAPPPAPSAAPNQSSAPSFPQASARGLRAPVQYVNAARAIPAADGLLLYLFAAGPDAARSATGVDPVVKLLVPPGFLVNLLDLLAEQAQAMGLLPSEVSADAPSPPQT